MKEINRFVFTLAALLCIALAAQAKTKDSKTTYAMDVLQIGRASCRERV